MIDVLEYLFTRLKQPFEPVRVVEGQAYAVKADGTLGAAVRELEPQFTKPALQLGTLQGFVDAYNELPEALPGTVPDNKAVVQIVDHRTVVMVDLHADDFGRRQVWLKTTHTADTPFEFGKYYTPEEFLIAFRASFYFNDEAVKVQRVTSTLSADNSVTLSDDGMSQSVVIKQGAVSREAVVLPAEGITLVPWRTFREVNPVASKFLLRMKNVKDGIPLAALYEIDAKWRLDTIASIRSWLVENLPDAMIIS